MSDPKQINPYEILVFRKKIKKFQQTGISQCMKILKQVREMKLQTNMLKCLQMPRVLLWVSRKITNDKDQNKVKLNKMCRFLYKEWKDQIQKDQARENQ